MTSVHRLLSHLCAAVLFAFAAAAPAQDIRYIHPEKYERATKTDDAGLVQWDAHKEIQCQTCSGTGKIKCPTCERFYDDAEHCIECARKKETVCRSCGGLGHFPDPLEKVLCPGCKGAGFIECGLCSGGGRIKSESGGDRWSRCPACRGDGGWKCQGCKGERLVDAVQLKPSLKEANVQTLDKAIATTDEVLAELGKWSPGEHRSSRNAVKELLKVIKAAHGVYPVLKKTDKTCEEAMNKTYGGAQYQEQAEREGAVMGGYKDSVDYFLRHQRRMMELAKKRQEANEKVAEANKEK